MVAQIDSARTRMLPGQARSRARPSGGTALPIEVPTMTKSACRAASGSATGRRTAAAAATVTMAPVSQGAGRPSQAKMVPPASPARRVGTSFT